MDKRLKIRLFTNFKDISYPESANFYHLNLAAIKTKLLNTPSRKDVFAKNSSIIIKFQILKENCNLLEL